MLNLQNKTILLTGGTGFIGKAFARSLASHGANIAIVDIDEQKCQNFCSELTTTTVEAVPFACDLADDAKVHALPRQVYDTFGSLDILINNAGFVGTGDLAGWVTPFEKQSSDTWRKACEVNMTAPFTLCREAAPYLRKKGQGSIINVGSIYAVLGPDMSLYDDTPMGNPAAYAASKGALLQMTRWLSTVLAPEIRVNSLCPGGVWRNQPETFVKRYEARTPMKRMGTEQDMVGTMLYLASDMSLYVTGQNIMVDGGWSAW